MKKRLAIIGACTTLLFSFGAAAPASADNGPHVAGAGVVADGCAACHRTHTAQAGKLLKQAQTGLCYSCHGTSGAGASTDVQGGNGYAGAGTGIRGAATGALRGGGFETARLDSGNTTSLASGIVPVRATGIAVTSAHTVDGATGTAWGNGALSTTANPGTAINLTCGSCHDPHGNGNYRILRPIPTSSGAAGTGITEALTTVKTYTTVNYWAVSDVNTAGYITNVSAWCSTCHTRYLAGSGSSSTDSTDAIFRYRHTSNAANEGGPSCIKCHVSHGSNAAMSGTASAAAGLVNPGTTTNTITSSKLLRIDNRGVCQQCHNK